MAPKTRASTQFIYSKPTTGQLRESQGECFVCDGNKRINFWIQCDNCEHYYHPQCINLTEEYINNIPEDDPFTCLFCEQTSDKPIEEENDENSATDMHCDADYEYEMTQDDQLNNSRDDESIVDTDEEGESHVRKILEHQQLNDERQFKVLYWKNNEILWHKESDLENCIEQVNIYCLREGIPISKLPCKKTLGASKKRIGNKANYVSIEDILQKIQVYGKNEGPQPEVFDVIGEKDAIYLIPIGRHCFTALYYAETRTCLVADGENALSENKKARKLLLSRLRGAKYIKYLHFNGQLEPGHCGSSAAGIAIEFQRLYKNKTIPKEVVVPDTIMQRIRKVLHKVPDEKIREWKPAAQIKWKAECEKCGKKFNTKNRGALNLHKC